MIGKSLETFDWKGHTKLEYPYYVYDKDSVLGKGSNLLPGTFGNFIFAKRVADGWKPLFIGEGDLFLSIKNKKLMEYVNHLEFTHIHFHPNNGTAERNDEKVNLLASHHDVIGNI